MTTALETLTYVRDRLANEPGLWTKSASARMKMRPGETVGARCSPFEQGAVRFSVGGLCMRHAFPDKEPKGMHSLAWQAFEATVKRLHAVESAGRWEDDPKTTLAMVLHALSEAIYRETR